MARIERVCASIDINFSPETENVYAVAVKAVDAQRNLAWLNEKYPMPPSIGHAKRIWRRPVENSFELLLLLGLVKLGKDPVDAYLSEFGSDMFPVQIEKLPVRSARTKNEIDQWRLDPDIWPTIFHEQRGLLKEQLSELEMIRLMYTYVDGVFREHPRINVAILDPNRLFNDYSHWVLDCQDFDVRDGRFSISCTADTVNNENYDLCDIEKSKHDTLPSLNVIKTERHVSCPGHLIGDDDPENYLTTRFKPFLNQVDALNEPVMRAIEAMAKKQLGNTLNQTSDYLCTGKVLFCRREPSLMASMALVHSRIKAIVFLEHDPDRGALFSKLRLQDVSGTNHHFSVFHLIVD